MKPTFFHRKLESRSRKGSEKPKVVGASREARSDRKTCKGEDFGSESSPRGRIEIRNFHGRRRRGGKATHGGWTPVPERPPAERTTWVSGHQLSFTPLGSRT